jgi:hypothetical protein
MKLLYSIHKYDVFMFTWLINARMYSALTKAGRYRVILGVHFPTDILAGVILGISTALFSLGQI